MLLLISIAVTLLTFPSAKAQGFNQQLFISVKTIPSSGSNTCPPEEDLNTARSQLQDEILDLLRNVTDSVECGGLGWSPYFSLDTSDTSQECPSPLTIYTDATSGKRVCGRQSPFSFISCASTILQGSHTQPYSEICGRIVGYQYGRLQAFGYYAERNRVDTIDQYYVDGITLTHGDPGNREHIWTFAVGIAESHNEYACPCALSGLGIYNANPPSFVGEEYFCETGYNADGAGPAFAFYAEDPLWDGKQCSAGNNCCSLHNPPYFTKKLGASTSDNIELRICSRHNRETSPGGDTFIEVVELYVR